MARIRGIGGVLGISLQRGASVEPPGDVLRVRTTAAAASRFLAFLDEAGVASGAERSVATSEPRCVLVSRAKEAGVEADRDEGLWEEMGHILRIETNVRPNYLALMALSGGITAAGLWTNTLHVVIAAMVVAPGYEPIVRVPFGLVAGPAGHARSGLASTLAGYAVLVLSAAVATALLAALEPEATRDLATRSWVQYWSTLTRSNLVLTVVAAAAGAVVVATLRTVLTAGVMIALALVPSSGIVGMALALGDVGLAADALVRWAVDVAAVAVMGGAVFALKQRTWHRRRARL